MRNKLRLEDDTGFALDDVTLVGGVDISFVKDSATEACASLIVVQRPALQVVYEDTQAITLDQPYIPGFLAFREVRFLIELIDRLKSTQPHLLPQVILVDGNGILHPRGKKKKLIHKIYTFFAKGFFFFFFVNALPCIRICKN